jgi:hypothetical protein
MAQFFTARWLGCLAMALVPLCAAVSGCVDDASEEPLADASPLSPASEGRSVPFVELEARASGRPPGELRRVLTSREQYRALLGAEPPPEIDFRQHWVVYYAAGVRPTGGYDASIAGIRLSRSGRILTITTELVEPGPGCIVTQALTHPYVLVRFPRQEGVRRFAFEHEDVERACTEMSDEPDGP